MAKRLLFVSNLFPDSSEPYRGLDNATVLHGLRRDHGWEIEVLALRPSLRPGFHGASWQARAGDEVLNPHFVRVPYIPKLGSTFNPSLYRWAIGPVLRRLCARFAPQVVLAAWLFPDGVAMADLCKGLGLRCVLLTQGSDTHQYLRSGLRRRSILRAIELSQGVIARSGDLAKRLESAGAEPTKLWPILNGVDQSIFRPQDQSAARAELGVGPGAEVLLYVGNLLPIKNPALLLRSFALHIKARSTESLLVMVGKGPLRPSLEALAAELGVAEHVRFTGPLNSSDIARWMAAANLLCMTSVNEGLPNVILEALNCGLPVLSTRVGGIHEVIDESALGRLVDSDSDQVYSGELSATLASSLDRQVVAARGSQYSWHRALSLYDDCVSQRRSKGVVECS
jgi:teichuronic acid biosynthesis glycosyltransferase TuaC